MRGGREEGGREGGWRGIEGKEGWRGEEGSRGRREGREISTCTASSAVDVPSAETTPLLQTVPLTPQTATVIVQQPTPASPKFRDFPVVLTDDKGNQYTTELHYVNGMLTWVAVGITCLVAGIYISICIFMHNVIAWCIIGASLSEAHTYCTAVQNPPYIYIYVPLVRPSVRRPIWPAKGPFKCTMRKRRTGSKGSKVNNIAWKMATLVLRFS